MTAGVAAAGTDGHMLCRGAGIPFHPEGMTMLRFLQLSSPTTCCSQVEHLESEEAAPRCRFPPLLSPLQSMHGDILYVGSPNEQQCHMRTLKTQHIDVSASAEQSVVGSLRLLEDSIVPSRDSNCRYAGDVDEFSTKLHKHRSRSRTHISPRASRVSSQQPSVPISACHVVRSGSTLLLRA